MSYDNLENKPLVEAIFELKWEIITNQDGTKTDPFYQILVGKYFSAVEDKFPVWQKLPTAEIPEQFVSYMPHHQFRRGQGQWPLIQIGPGILTVNDTEKYIWDDFKKICLDATNALFQTYPQKEGPLNVMLLNLRYVDADKDLEQSNLKDFLSKFKIDVRVPETLFEDGNVMPDPTELKIHMDFIANKPKGRARLKIGNGRKEDSNALIWETAVCSTKEDIPNMPDGIENWLTDAHKITHNWFISLTKGELLEKYK